MQDTGNLLTRDDTFFGVCQGLGEDLGFSPQYLRAALAVALFFDPVAVILVYAALGLVVAAARFAYPVPRTAAPAPQADAGEPQPALAAAAQAEEDAVPLAA